MAKKPMKHSDAAEDKKLIRKEIMAFEKKEDKAEEKAKKSAFKFAGGGDIKKPKKDPYAGDKTGKGSYGSNGRPPSTLDQVPADEGPKYARGGSVKTCRGGGAAIKGKRYFD